MQAANWNIPAGEKEDREALEEELIYRRARSCSAGLPRPHAPTFCSSNAETNVSGVLCGPVEQRPAPTRQHKGCCKAVRGAATSPKLTGSISPQQKPVKPCVRPSPRPLIPNPAAPFDELVSV